MKRSASWFWMLVVIMLNFSIGSAQVIDASLPSIVSQPEPVTALTGRSVRFAVVASGDPPLAYQWQRNGIAIPGENRPTLAVTNAQRADSGEYRVVVSNSRGSAISAGALLSVRPVLLAPIGDPPFAPTMISVQVAEGSVARIWVATNTLGPWIGWTNVASTGDGTAQLVHPRASTSDYFYRAVVRERTTPSEFVWVSPGTCLTEYAVAAIPIYFRVRPLSVVNGFWICSNEVTQQEYEAVMGTNPSFNKGVDRPVEMVSWDDAVEYCRKLTETERAAGRINAKQTYRLPTADEWEYAARAGHGESRGEASELVRISVSWINSKAYPTRTAAPNALGLHDMLGNVAEWCSDSWGVNSRFWCGSGMCDDDLCCRYSQRSADPRDGKNPFLGFRVVLSNVP